MRVRTGVNGMEGDRCRTEISWRMLRDKEAEKWSHRLVCCTCRERKVGTVTDDLLGGFRASE